MKYAVTIEEHISQKFILDAEDIAEAMSIAEERYRTCEYVVNPAPPTARLMMAQGIRTNEETEWREF